MTAKKEAEQLHRQGKLAEAKKLYEAYLREHSDDAETHHALGVLLAQSGQFEASLFSIQKAIKLKKNQASYYNSLGNVLKHLNKLQDARKAYQKAIKKQPGYAIAYNNLGCIFYAEKKFIAAKKAYQKAIKLKGDYADPYFNLGILLTEYHENEEAIKNLKKALSLKPTMVSALSQLGDIYLRQANYSEAIHCFSKRLEKTPEHIDSQNSLGIAYLKIDEIDKAIQQFEKVLSLDAKHPEVNQHLATALLLKGDHTKALAYYFRQLEQNPLMDTYYNIGTLLMFQERHKDALHYLEKAIQMDPEFLPAQINVGNIYLAQNKLDKAIECYQQAGKIDPDNPEIQYILAAMSQKNMPEKAPAPYLKHLFDNYAAHFEKHLTDCLHYSTPKQLYTAVKQALNIDNASWRILDLGCGTGLAGEQFKPFANEMIGVDLSEEMIAVAEKKNIYNQLLVQDVEIILDEYSNLDLILAADVFPYIGKLDDIFAKVAQALRTSGLFAFTVEKGHGEDFKLLTSIRYVHSKNYLTKLAKQCHFNILIFDNFSGRKQQNKPVEGYLVVLQKSGV